MTSRPRILFIDAYDSFSNNIVSLLTTVLNADVDILPIDSAAFGVGDPHRPQFRDELRRTLGTYHGVVCGPGPGSPTEDLDVGLMRHIWELPDADLIPVLGICLGFQSLVASCGGKIRRLSTGLHGMIRNIDHAGLYSELSLGAGNIFKDVAPFKATLYHSLHADIGQAVASEEEWQTSKWQSPASAPDLAPQAWVHEDREDGRPVERILMAVKHKTKPFWGLQYHPESICTETAGHRVIQNWFSEAIRWNEDRGRGLIAATDITARPSGTTQLPHARGQIGVAAANAHLSVDQQEKHDLDARPWFPGNSPLASFGVGAEYHYRKLRLPRHVEVADLVERLQGGQKNYIILDSASAHAARIGSDVRGRYSVVALDVDESLRLEYRTGSGYVTVRQDDSQRPEPLIHETIRLGPGQTAWQFLSDFWDRRQMDIADDSEIATSPCFRGGFIGFVTYEMGLEGINVLPVGKRTHDRPDLCFAWVTRSLVLDHIEGSLYVQCLSPPTQSSHATQIWLDHLVRRLKSWPLWSDYYQSSDDDFDNSSVNGFRGEARLCSPSQQYGQPTPPLTPKLGPSKTKKATRRTKTVIRAPEAEEYEAKVRRCQDLIAAGDSYELCLTDQTLISKARSPQESLGAIPTARLRGSFPEGDESDSRSSWSLYRALRTRNPSPFGSYLRLGGATLISSSPERFLEYSADGLCSMRPMKGTVKKTPAAPAASEFSTKNTTPTTTTASTLAEAEAILHVPKEEAENLMIVDLVRHDLHGVCGPGAVDVPQLLVVEEYASVFQMVSVVEGRLPQYRSTKGEDNAKAASRTTGLDVLAASLPPGSMTGAPKKRSCELLGEIEHAAAAAAAGGSDTATTGSSSSSSSRRKISERSLYSGVVGYMDVTGRGDWSVTIRSLFRWDDEIGDPGEEEAEEEGPALETWHIGAGGAVTALSTPEGESDEMFTKLRGPLGIFQGC